MGLSPSDWRSDELLFGVVLHAVGSALVLAASTLAIMGPGPGGLAGAPPGFLIFGLSAASQVRFRTVLEQAIAPLRVWTIVVPWELGFAANDAATWTHTVLGALAFAATAAREAAIIAMPGREKAAKIWGQSPSEERKRRDRGYRGTAWCGGALRWIKARSRADGKVPPSG
jgi:hypothetical protein